MKIQNKEITIRDLIKDYKNNKEQGVYAYSGKLNIRPKYQREFIYKDNQRNAVIDTIIKGYPLNTIYWVKNGEDDYEVLDGQQRTMSICKYFNNEFSIKYNGNKHYIQNLPNDIKEKILNYKLSIYICEGNESEKLDWFKIINISGEKLTQQELLNAVYFGKWLSDAKSKFSKTNGPAHNLSREIINGNPIRQEILETALKWIANRDNITPTEYMSRNQKEQNANWLWLYFQNVINWTQTLFPDNRKEKKSVNWGELYNKYKDKKFDNELIKNKTIELMQDDEVTKKSGIYIYLITDNEKYLNIRAFSQSQKREQYEKQNGICVKCDVNKDIESMDADHILPWSKGGKTIASNLQMLCKKCNQEKGNK